MAGLMRDTGQMSSELDRLLDLLDLEQIELNIFRGRSPKERVQRVFGGQVRSEEHTSELQSPC